MKILGISCSLRKESNSEMLVKEALTTAAEAGADTDLVTLQGKNIKPCDGCFACSAKGICHIKDDMQDIYPKVINADGIIFSTPVFFWSVAGQTKCLIDRLYALYQDGRLLNKVGGVITIASSMGHAGAINLFYTFFAASHIFAADFVYGYGRDRGEISKDRHAMQSARELGKQMVLMTGKGFKYPEPYNIAVYRYVQKNLGIDSCPPRGRFQS